MDAPCFLIGRLRSRLFLAEAGQQQKWENDNKYGKTDEAIRILHLSS